MAAVAGCCRACSYKQKPVCWQSELQQRALRFHHVCSISNDPRFCHNNPLCQCISREGKTESVKHPHGVYNCMRDYLRKAAVLFLETLWPSYPETEGPLFPSYIYTLCSYAIKRWKCFYISLSRSSFTLTQPLCLCQWGCCSCMPACVFISGSSQHGRHVLCYC